MTLQSSTLYKPWYTTKRYVHPSNWFPFSQVGSWWQQVSQGVPVVLRHSNTVQLQLRDLQAFPGLMGCIIPPASAGFTRCPRNLHRKVPRRILIIRRTISTGSSLQQVPASPQRSGTTPASLLRPTAIPLVRLSLCLRCNAHSF